jgi:hypothetical protein
MRGRRGRVRGAAFFALLALGGCGGDDSSDPDEFIARGNTICTGLSKDFAKLGQPPPAGTARRAAWDFQVQALAQRAFARLEELDPPSELEDDRDKIVAAVELNQQHIRRLRELADQTSEELAAGVTDGPAQRAYQDLSAKTDGDALRVGSLLRSIGWTECAMLTG